MNFFLLYRIVYIKTNIAEHNIYTLILKKNIILVNHFNKLFTRRDSIAYYSIFHSFNMFWCILLHHGPKAINAKYSTKNYFQTK